MHLDIHSLFREIPDNAYVKQLVTGFRWLRFTPALEREYLSHIGETQVTQHKIAMLLALAIWLLFAAVDIERFHLLQRFPDYSFNLWLLLAVRWSIMLIIVAIAALLFAGRLLSQGPKVAAGLLFVLGAGTALLIILYKFEEGPQGDSALLLVIIAVFFPLGLSFYQSIGVALSICLATTLIGLLLLSGDAGDEFNRLAGLLLLAVVIGAVGGYMREYAQREQFLLRHLLSWQATRDPLTGLHNRRSFNLNLDLALRRARREGRALALVMIDVDHFKLYNDHYGHQAGDQALQRVGQVLMAFARRPMDLAVRLGGEEFALLLYATDQEQVRELTGQLQAALSALGIAHGFSPTAAHLTASVGALLARPDETADSLYQRADELLYQAKQTGRNRVTLADAAI
ncbi:MAG TPA: GGDEF domain-containing protein [Pseudomonas sp.]|nr:GGDEF domain-containing protein [Pseudomonas sp.]